MRSGDRPGLQNRRAAGNPVAGGFDPHSLPPFLTRINTEDLHFRAIGCARYCANLRHDRETPSRSRLRSEPSERLPVLPPEEPFLREGLPLHEVAPVLRRCLPVRL